MSLLVSVLAILVESAPVVLLPAESARAKGVVAISKDEIEVETISVLTKLFVLTTPFYPISRAVGGRQQL